MALSPEQLRVLLAGVQLDDGPGRFDSVTPSRTEGAHAWYRVVLREGRNREVRRLWLAVGSEVSRLLRIRYGPVQLPKELATGAWQLLDAQQVAGLAAATAQTRLRQAPAAAEPLVRDSGSPWYRGKQR